MALGAPFCYRPADGRSLLVPGRAGRTLNHRLQVLRACVAADGKPDCGFCKEHPQQVYPRHLYLHRPHERSQLWKVSACALLEPNCAATPAFSQPCSDRSDSRELCCRPARGRMIAKLTSS